MKNRASLISGSIVFGPVVGGGIISIFLCFPISWWIFSTGITGLGLDLVGAILIVITEIAWFDQFWRSEEGFRESSRLNEARNRLYNEDVSLELGDSDFQRLIALIEDQQSIPIKPFQLKPPKPGGIGGSNHVRIFESNGGSNPQRIHIHNTLFNNWVDNRIEELQIGVRDSIRLLGLLSLFFGFSLQAISYLMRHSTVVGELVLLLPEC